MTAVMQTAILDPNAPRVETDPIRPLRFALTTWLAALAPVLFTLSNVLSPKLTGSTADVVRKIPAVADRLLAAHLLYAFASVLLIALSVALWRIDLRRGAALRFIGASLVIIGAVSNAFGEIVDGYLAWGMHRTGVADAAQIRLFDLLDNSSAALPISFLAIPVLSLGLVVLMVGVLRAKVVSPWLPAVTIVGGLGSGFAGVGLPALIGLTWSFAAAAIVLSVAGRAAPQS